jgi:hypothetical protein
MFARAWRAASKAAAQLAAGPSWWWKKASTASPMNFSTSPPWAAIGGTSWSK